VHCGASRPSDPKLTSVRAHAYDHIVTGKFLFSVSVLSVVLAFASTAETPAPVTPTVPVAHEWRAYAFMYTAGKYSHAVDMFEQSFATREQCIAAVNAGVAALAGSIQRGDGVAATCLPIPAFPKPPVT
jgi:hypothetical protein